MAYKHKHGKDADDSDDDGRVWFFLPSEDIDFDVLASDLRCYLGNGAQVEIGNHHRVSAACLFRHVFPTGLTWVEWQAGLPHQICCSNHNGMSCFPTASAASTHSHLWTKTPL